jgi:hypothetical protein
MQNISEIISSAGATFASFLYRSKSDGSLSRFTVILGAKYSNLLEKSKIALWIEMQTMEKDLLPAAQAVMESLDKSIEAHANGKQNENYTKAGMYKSIGNGVNINLNDNSLQIFGLIHSKVVIDPGTPRKPVNSAPLTIAKNKVRSLLPISKFREFAFDAGNIETVKVNGSTIEFVTL